MRCRIHPVQIVEHQHYRMLSRQPPQHGGNRQEQFLLGTGLALFVRREQNVGKRHDTIENPTEGCVDFMHLVALRRQQVDGEMSGNCFGKWRVGAGRTAFLRLTARPF